MEQVVCKNIQWEKIHVWCCGAFFPSGNIKQHQNEAHSNNVKTVNQKYVCGNCAKSFSRDCAARIHERSHKSQFACDICKKWFHQRSFLKMHKKICKQSLENCFKLKKSSEAASRPDKAEWSGKINSCDVMTNVNHGDDYFVLEDGLADNVKLCENNYQNLDQFKEQENKYPKERKISKKEICNICGTSILAKNMSQHVKHIHTMKDVKNFSCEYCGKSFKLNKDLTCHTAIHTGHKKKKKKNFSCLFCDKKFIGKYEAKLCENVRRHLQTKHKTGERTQNETGGQTQNKGGGQTQNKGGGQTQNEAGGSIISRLEALYPQMYDASESDEDLRNDPLFQNLVLVKRSTKKSKWKDQESVKYPIIARNKDHNNSALKDTSQILDTVKVTNQGGLLHLDNVECKRLKDLHQEKVVENKTEADTTESKPEKVCCTLEPNANRLENIAIVTSIVSDITDEVIKTKDGDEREMNNNIECYLPNCQVDIVEDFIFFSFNSFADLREFDESSFELPTNGAKSRS